VLFGAPTGLYLNCSIDPFSYLLVLISIVLALGMTRVLQGIRHFVAQGPQDVVSGIILFSTTVAGAIKRNETYHKLFAIYCLCHIVWISFAIFHTLR